MSLIHPGSMTRCSHDFDQRKVRKTTSTQLGCLITKIPARHESKKFFRAATWNGISAYMDMNMDDISRIQRSLTRCGGLIRLARAPRSTSSKNAATDLPVQHGEFRVHCSSCAGTCAIDQLSNVVEQGTENQISHT